MLASGSVLRRCRAHPMLTTTEDGLGAASPLTIPPAIVNAVVDALAPFGGTHVDMSLTAEKLWRAMQG
jgi:hypothetical protein